MASGGSFEAIRVELDKDEPGDPVQVLMAKVVCLSSATCACSSRWNSISQQDRKSPGLCWITCRFDSVAEASEFPYHSQSVYSPRPFAHSRAPFLVANPPDAESSRSFDKADAQSPR